VQEKKILGERIEESLEKGGRAQWMDRRTLEKGER